MAGTKDMAAKDVQCWMHGSSGAGDLSYRTTGEKSDAESVADDVHGKGIWRQPFPVSSSDQKAMVQREQRLFLRETEVHHSASHTDDLSLATHSKHISVTRSLSLDETHTHTHALYLKERASSFIRVVGVNGSY